MRLAAEIAELRLHGAAPCSEALKWLEGLGPSATLAEAWEQCPRADWILWWCNATDSGPSKQVLRRLAVRWRTRAARRWSERRALPLEPRSEELIRMAAAYAEGQATRQQLLAAARAAAAYDACVHAAADELRAEWTLPECLRSGATTSRRKARSFRGEI